MATPSAVAERLAAARAGPACRGDRAARAGRCASRRPAAARPRRSSRGSPGSSTAGSTRRRSAAITFNKRAAVELTERLASRAGAARRRRRAPSGCGRSTPSAARSCATRRAPVDPLADRAAILRRGRSLGRTRRTSPRSTRSSRGSRSSSAWPPAEVAARSRGGPDRRARSSPTSAALRATRRARLRRPHPAARCEPSRSDPALLARWRQRCAAPARRRGPGRRPGAAPARPPARRAGEPDLPRRRRRPVDLWLAARRRPAHPRPRRRCCRACAGSTSRSNYRCPRPVVERAVRLVEHNGERFAKAIRAGPAAAGRLVLAPDAADETVRLERVVRGWPDDGSTRAVLARTNRELLPAVVVALRAGSAVPGAAHRPAGRVAAGRRPPCAGRAAMGTTTQPLARPGRGGARTDADSAERGGRRRRSSAGRRLRHRARRSRGDRRTPELVSPSCVATTRR